MKYILIIFFFLSCSSSKKIKTDTRIEEKKDSVVVTHVDEKRDVQEKSYEGISFEKNMLIRFRNFEVSDTIWKVGSTARTPGPLTIYVPGIGNVDTRNLSSIEINNKEKRHKKKEKGNKSQIKTSTFSETHTEIKRDQKTETVKKDSVKLPSFNFKLWGIIAGVVLPLLIGGFIWWKKRKNKSLK